ncbi:MAG: helix-turn-helix transcriptional regulator [Lachnospiraceae bacterium]
MYLKRLEDLRIDHDFTQQQIADYLTCQREVYRRYEKGIRSIPVDYLIKLANYYHTSTDYLLALTDQKEPFSNRSK